MAFTMSQSALPVFINGLSALSGILDKAIEFAAAKKIDEAVLLQMRLSPDQFPLVRQIQIMTDSAKNGSARVVGVEAPKHADKEASFAELKTRIAETITFLETIDENAFNAGADKQVVFPLGKLYKGEMKGDDYVTHFMIANFYFHFTTAYAILRHSGVDIGKMSFLGSIPMIRTAV
jgi:hypothetical protein